jgi:hypothetical protein
MCPNQNVPTVIRREHSPTEGGLEAEHGLAATVETHDTAKRDPKRVTWSGHDPLAVHVAQCQRHLEGARHKQRDMTSEYQAEAV